MEWQYKYQRKETLRQKLLGSQRKTLCDNKKINPSVRYKIINACF